MIFTETILRGAYIIKPEIKADDRGFFARTFCQREFSEHHLNASIAQCSVSYNKLKGTFRGMHFQEPPFEEEKIVSCTQGALLDCIVDLRPDSPTFRKCIQVELTEANGFFLYIPKSFAHGFLTLTDNTKVFYQITEFQHPESARGFRYNDPAFEINLPFDVQVICERDRNYPDLQWEPHLITLP